MRLVVLTTKTPHHTFFCRELAQRHSLELAILETTGVNAKFPTAHEFESKRDEYEIQSWFSGKAPGISDICKTLTTSNINDSICADHLRRIRPNVVIVFGTRKLKQELIDTSPDSMLNLHGGDPEKYRGLDSHLWACYHQDFDALATCLHHLRSDLDAGEIVAQKKIPIFRNMKLHQLRKANTDLCIELVLRSLMDIENSGRIQGTPQRAKGRYYSFMPAVLKDIALRNFEKYAESL